MKKNMLHMFFCLNAILFSLIVNPYSITMNTFLLLWGWSMWIYLIFSLSLIYSNLCNFKYDFKNQIKLVINIVSQIGICMIFSLAYGKKIKFENFFVIQCTMTILIIIEFITVFWLKASSNRYVLTDQERDNAIDDEELKSFVNNKILNIFKYNMLLSKLKISFPFSYTDIKYENEIRLSIVLKNIFSGVLIMIFAFLDYSLFDSMKDFVIANIIFAIEVVIVFLSNYSKYDCLKSGKIRYIADNILACLSIYVYAFSSFILILDPFPAVFIAMYLLAPYLVSFAKIINIFQLGKHLNNK